MTLTYREGNIEDSRAVFQVFVKSIMDYSERMGVMAITGGNDPAVIESLWQKRRSMFEFLVKNASQFWVAEQDGEIVAYARSVEHDGLQELTEFFVEPGQQSGGIGGGLLARAFPKTDARYRTIIATLDERALYHPARQMAHCLNPHTRSQQFSHSVCKPGHYGRLPSNRGQRCEHDR